MTILRHTVLTPFYDNLMTYYIMAIFMILFFNYKDIFIDILDF